jgi:ubiquinone/menaquinone biosynthesis C-methylase UbiE
MSERIVGKTKPLQHPQHEPCAKDALRHTCHHRWNSSENLLNKATILKKLDIRSGQTIVDAGCGNGYMARTFFKALNGTGIIYALDQSAEAIESLRQETIGTNIFPATTDITQLTPIQESSVDLIYLSNVFHVFSKGQIQGFNKEVRRLLKPGGRLAVVELKKQPTPIGPPLNIRIAPKELERAIDLMPVGRAEVGPYHYMQIFRRKG